METSSEPEAPPLVPDEAQPWLAGLHRGDTLTFTVREADGEDQRVRMRVDRLHSREESVAVLLSPVGLPLGGGTPIFVGWVVATAEGVFGLESTAVLSEPGYVPLDAAGRLVTEALAAISWHVPPGWFRASAAAFDRGESVEGWTLTGVEDRIAGPVIGERCVRMERTDGDLEATMTVCANLGMTELVRRGHDAGEQSWRLVDLGRLPAELDPDPDAATDDDSDHPEPHASDATP